MASPANVPASTPIAHLNPDLRHDDSSVAGVVTLIWPYAAFKSTFSLLLVDPDFRLRSSRGQVRVHFQGSSAKAVAKTGISSGDRLLLSLRGAQWVKDTTAASTPGRGIDWQLQYGERLVLQVRGLQQRNRIANGYFLQIHRPSQRPTTLDIDHPTPSPEPPLQTSTPVQSPPHNNHYASSTGTALLDAQLWASPAFLKRSRIFTTNYDPFIEDEFPDNGRRKRTKFGRGSDQWRFAERTPSPENQSETPSSEIASPSIPPAQDRPRVEESQPPLQEVHSTNAPPAPSSSATKDLIDRSELEVLSEGEFTGKDTSAEDREGPPTSLGQVNVGDQMIYEDSEDGNIGNIAIATPETPRTKSDLNEVDVEASTTRPTSPTSDAHPVGDEESREAAQTVQASPPASIEISSPTSSLSTPRNDLDLDEESDQASDDATHKEFDSLFDEQSEFGQSDAVVPSGPGSDVGLDGSTFSRPPPGLELAMPSNIIKMLEEGIEAGSMNADDAQHTSLPLQSDVEQTGSEAEEPSVSKHFARGSLSSTDEASEEGTESFEDHDAAQRRSSVQAPPPDQLGSPDTAVVGDQASKSPAAAQLSPSNQDSWKDTGAHQEDRVPRSSSNLPSSPHHFEIQKPQESLELSSQEISDERAAPELIPKKYATDSPGKKSLSSNVEEIDPLTASDVENTLDTSPEKGPLDSTVQQESLFRHQQEIVLDARLHHEFPRTVQPQGWDFKERADHSSTMPSMPSVVQPSTVEIIDLESGDEDNDLSPHDVAQKDFQATVDESDLKFTPTQKVSADETPLILAVDASNEDQTSIDEVSSLSSIPEFTQLVLKSATEIKDFPPAGVHMEPEARQEALELAQEGFRTQPLVARSKKYLEEPPSIQEAPLVQSEVISQSLERELPSEEKPQLKNLAIVETELMSIPTDELPSTVPDSFDELKSKSQLLTPRSTQQTNLASQSSSVSLHSAPEDDILPTPRLTQAASVESALPQRLASPEEPVFAKTSAPPKKTPTLIERLKEMRRLASQSPKPRPSDAAILDPWFAPRRLSQVVPDSEDGSEAESSPERKAQVRVPEISSEHLPQTPEKPLAKSFIRSPPQPKDISSIQSSPQYLPPSQPPPPGFRTNLSYFVPLATVPSHFATAVDVLVIALSSTPVTRATSGPKDYNQSLYITDPSSLTLQHTVTTVQIFRPNNRCFPIVEKGAALLLRDFKVQPFEKRLLLLSTESSAWAVFRKGADVQIRGPPVEYGAAERGFARGLWDWWASLGDGTRRRLETAVPEYKKPNGATKIKKSTTGGNKSKVEIEGVGLDLSGSQSKRRESAKERSVALDGVEERDMVYESIEAPKRVLRARGSKGANGRSESARESRFGTVFTGGLGEPDETQGSAHELRDGKAYRAKGR